MALSRPPDSAQLRFEPFPYIGKNASVIARTHLISVSLSFQYNYNTSYQISQLLNSDKNGLYLFHEIQAAIYYSLNSHFKC